MWRVTAILMLLCLASFPELQFQEGGRSSSLQLIREALPLTSNQCFHMTPSYADYKSICIKEYGRVSWDCSTMFNILCLLLLQWRGGSCASWTLIGCVNTCSSMHTQTSRVSHKINVCSSLWMSNTYKVVQEVTGLIFSNNSQWPLTTPTRTVRKRI